MNIPHTAERRRATIVEFAALIPLGLLALVAASFLQDWRAIQTAILLSPGVGLVGLWAGTQAASEWRTSAAPLVVIAAWVATLSYPSCGVVGFALAVGWECGRLIARQDRQQNPAV